MSTSNLPTEQEEVIYDEEIDGPPPCIDDHADGEYLDSSPSSWGVTQRVVVSSLATALLPSCSGKGFSPPDWLDSLPQCIQVMIVITIMGCSIPLGLWCNWLMFGERPRHQRGWGFDPHEDIKFIIEHSIDEPDASAESDEPVTFLTRTGEPLLVSPAVKRKLLALRTKLTVHAPTNSQTQLH